MPFDSMPHQYWDKSEWCQSCKKPIGPDEPVEHLRFDNHAEHRLEDLSGPYHAECARPFLSVKRALDMLGWRPI